MHMPIYVKSHRPNLSFSTASCLPLGLAHRGSTSKMTLWRVWRSCTSLYVATTLDSSEINFQMSITLSRSLASLCSKVSRIYPLSTFIGQQGFPWDTNTPRQVIRFLHLREGNVVENGSRCTEEAIRSDLMQIFDSDDDGDGVRSALQYA
jgi:hypothetical protein